MSGEAWRRITESGVLDEPPPACSDPQPEGLIEGIRLFNAGEYYECHEELEAIWLEERGPIRYLYQGILQIGVGFHHLRNGNFRGTRLLLENGIAKVERFQPLCMGVDTLRLRDESQACLDQLLELGSERIAGFAWESVPKVWVLDGDAETGEHG
jgi:predicted metal-dependent hydrolase